MKNLLLTLLITAAATPAHGMLAAVARQHVRHAHDAEDQEFEQLRNNALRIIREANTAASNGQDELLNALAVEALTQAQAIGNFKLSLVQRERYETECNYLQGRLCDVTTKAPVPSGMLSYVAKAFMPIENCLDRIEAYVVYYGLGYGSETADARVARVEAGMRKRGELR